MIALVNSAIMGVLEGKLLLGSTMLRKEGSVFKKIIPIKQSLRNARPKLLFSKSKVMILSKVVKHWHRPYKGAL